MMHDIKWSKSEKSVARSAFDAAFQRECEEITAMVKDMIAAITKPADLWQMHDYLTEQLEKIDQKYDYRYSVLLRVFARLLNEGWLQEVDLEGLEEDKIQKIRFLAGV